MSNAAIEFSGTGLEIETGVKLESVSCKENEDVVSECYWTGTGFETGLKLAARKYVVSEDYLYWNYVQESMWSVKILLRD
jgi:hypothetical protein